MPQYDVQIDRLPRPSRSGAPVRPFAPSSTPFLLPKDLCRQLVMVVASGPPKWSANIYAYDGQKVRGRCSSQQPEGVQSNLSPTHIVVYRLLCAQQLFSAVDLPIRAEPMRIKHVYGACGPPLRHSPVPAVESLFFTRRRHLFCLAYLRLSSISPTDRTPTRPRPRGRGARVHCPPRARPARVRQGGATALHPRRRPAAAGRPASHRHHRPPHAQPRRVVRARRQPSLARRTTARATVQSHRCCCCRWKGFGRTFLSQRTAERLGPGLDVWHGFQFSIRPTQSGPALIVDRALGAFKRASALACSAADGRLFRASLLLAGLLLALLQTCVCPITTHLLDLNEVVCAHLLVPSSGPSYSQSIPRTH